MTSLQQSANTRLRWFIGSLAIASFLGYWQVNTRVLQQTGPEPCKEAIIHPAAAGVRTVQDDADIAAHLPAWLQEYGTWHQEAISQLNATNWRSQRFLVMTAIRGRRTGGLTDRLKPLPFFLKLAATTNRILLIYWSKPFTLEQYLLPPEGGFDWRVPRYMVDAIATAKLETRPEGVRRLANDTGSGTMFLATQMQAHDYGEGWYDDNPLDGDNNNNRKDVFRHMWHWTFTPTPPIAQRIQEEFDYMGVTPGNYAAAHIRAVYAVKERSDDTIVRMTKHAMDCVSMLRPGGPFFVASDTDKAITVAKAYGRIKNVTVVASSNHNHSNRKDPLHLDMYNTTDPSIMPEDFYDAFVDLYLLGSTRCIAHGQGSFGHWGYLLGYDPSCEIRHFKGPQCAWTDGPTSTATAQQQQMRVVGVASKEPPSRPLFRQPMSYDSIYAYRH